jgi:hypothetical protein
MFGLLDKFTKPISQKGILKEKNPLTPLKILIKDADDRLVGAVGFGAKVKLIQQLSELKDNVLKLNSKISMNIVAVFQEHNEFGNAEAARKIYSSHNAKYREIRTVINTLLDSATTMPLIEQKGFPPSFGIEDKRYLLDSLLNLSLLLSGLHQEWAALEPLEKIIFGGK